MTRGKRAYSSSRHKFVVNHLQHSSRDLRLHRNILTHKGVEHIRANLKMLSGVVHIVGEVAGAGVPEGVLEILADQIQDVRPFLQEGAVGR